MEKKLTKNEKGITLVALIITIIILLILAVVSIRAITGDNILGKSETAKEKYESAKKDEADKLGNYANSIETNGNNKNNESNAKYFRGIADGEIIVKMANNKLEFYYRGEESGPYYKIPQSNYDGYYVISLNTKVKSSGSIHNYDKVWARISKDESEYRDDDIIIENVHYSTTDIFLISDTEACNDPSNWYYANEEESLMEEESEYSICTLLTDFDTSLLSEEEISF